MQARHQRRRLRTILPGLAVAALAGCGPSYSPDTYSSSAVQQANKVERGVIIGIRPVDVSSSGVVGAGAGAAAGGALGAQAPGGSVTSTLGAVGGALIGGLVGVGTEKAVADTKAWEYIVRKPNGELVSVTQQDKTPLPIGQKVLVIAGSQARIVADYTKDPPTDEPASASPPAVAAPAASTPAAPAILPPITQDALPPVISPTAPANSSPAAPMQLAPAATSPATPP